MEIGRGTLYSTKAALTFATALLYLQNGYLPAPRVFKGNLIIYIYIYLYSTYNPFKTLSLKTISRLIRSFLRVL